MSQHKNRGPEADRANHREIERGTEQKILRDVEPTVWRNSERAQTGEPRRVAVPRQAQGRHPSDREGVDPEASREASMRFYPPREVSALLGVSRRQLQYWARTDLVRPSCRTQGGHHRYSFEDLVALKAVKRLIDAGVSVQKVRSSIDAIRRTLPEVDRPLSELVLVATGDVVLVFSEGTVFEAISGQEWVFDVAQFRRDVDAWNLAAGGTPVRGVRPVRGTRRRNRGAG